MISYNFIFIATIRLFSSYSVRRKKKIQVCACRTDREEIVPKLFIDILMHSKVEFLCGVICKFYFIFFSVDRTLDFIEAKNLLFIGDYGL